MRKFRLRFGNYGKHLALILLTLLTIYPFFYTIVTSLKNNAQIDTQFWEVFPRPIQWENYRHGWKGIYCYLPNSILVSGLTVMGMLFLSSLSAFVFARFKFPGKELLFYLILALLMVPGVLTLIPSFILVTKLHLFNNLGGLILPYIAGGQVFAIFILRGFFATIPQDYFDAAHIDGASEFQVYLRIVLPLSKPILGTVAIMNVLGTWNDYIWPMIVISTPKWRTVSIGLTYFRGEYHVYQGHLMAANVIASIPIIILFLFTMRYFIRGLSSGGIKV